MSENDESEILEEIVAPKVAQGAPKMKVVLKDKKSLLVKRAKQESEEGSETLVSDNEVPKLKVIIKKKVKVIELEDEDEDDEDEVIEKPKKARTQKQIDAFQKVRDKKMENAKKREEDKKKLAEYEKKALEEKIIKKAVSIKKKQIKKQQVLEEISDDETPIEVIKEMKAKQIVKDIKPIKEKPKYNFI